MQSSALCRRQLYHVFSRQFQTESVKPKPKSFSDTLLLPQTSFPLWSKPEQSELPFRSRTSDELYQWQEKTGIEKKRPLFTLHDGPPYANGDLHMGHALNKVLKDIINRFQVLTGKQVHYVPGWDCHGLPIENKALKEIGKDARSLPATAIRTVARQTALREIDNQRSQFRQLGIMADWDSQDATYRTLDHKYEMRQLQVFQQMVEKGLIYRHFRPVYYSPSSMSALAEAELKYVDDHVSHSVYVTFDVHSSKVPAIKEVLEGGVKLVVWTTTPWTLTANMGIAVNPDMAYSALRRKDNGEVLVIGSDLVESFSALFDGALELKLISEFSGTELVGTTYTPIFSTSSSSASPKEIVPSSHVTPDSGTGLVHCAPAHGPEDYALFKSLNLLPASSSSKSSDSLVCHVDATGSFSPEVLDVVSGSDGGRELIGLAVLDEGSREIVKILKDRGRLMKIQRFKHRYPYDWKTAKPIIITATSQWFADLTAIKAPALGALDHVNFYPPQSRNRLESFVSSRSEWCISRQRVWGVPIPSLHHPDSNTSVLTPSSLTHILSVLEEKGVEYWWEGPVSEFLPKGLAEETATRESEWVKGTDTMDVWFDSGSSWALLPERGSEKFADVCLEGSDQHRGWFQSQLLTKVSVSDKGDSPYKTLITHGMVLDGKGKKMSKSLGNIVDPLTVVNGGKDMKKNPAYGADILRLWAATVEYWRDMSLGPTSLTQTSESMRRIRNSARFMLGNIGSKPDFIPVEASQFGLAERYVMNELYTLEQTALEGYASYNFPKVMNVLGNFANITLSSLYFDITKDTLYADAVDSVERRRVVTVLQKILGSMTNVLAPVLPHLAEEIHNHQMNGKAVTSFFRNQWKPLGSEWKDDVAAAEMNQLLQVRKCVLGLLEEARMAKKLRSSLEAEVDIILPGDAEGGNLLQLVQREESFLKTLFIVSDVTVTDEGSLGTTSSDWLYNGTISFPDTTEELLIRVRPATLHKCPRCWTYTRHEHEETCHRCTQSS